MKCLVLIPLIPLLFCASAAQAMTMDYFCSDKAGNKINWEVNAGSEDNVQGINGSIEVVVNGKMARLIPDEVLASPNQPTLLFWAKNSQYAIVAAIGKTPKTEFTDRSAYVEFAVKGKKGMLRVKREIMKCTPVNDA
jgi:hypothetical protein